MSEPDDCDDPSLAPASRIEDRDEMMRKWWRKFYLTLLIGIPVGMWLCYRFLRPTP